MRLLLLALLLFAATATAADLAEPESEPARIRDYADLWLLYEAALAGDPRILAAQARATGGEGRRQEARGQLLPQLAATASLTRNLRDDGRFRDFYHGERYALQLNQILFDPGAWRSYQRYTALADQLDAEASDVEAEATVDLIRRYFAVLAAEDELALVQAERRTNQGNLDRVNRLFERQLARINDVLDVSARVDTLVANEIEAANAVALARESLAEVVGVPVPAALARIHDDSRMQLPAMAGAAWEQRALAHNPALAARARELAAAEAAVREARAGHLPTVRLFATAQESDVGYDNSLVPQSETYVVGVGVELPLFSGGGTRGRVLAQEAALTEARHRYEAARRAVIRETRTAWLTLQASDSRLAATTAALTSTARAREAAERAFSYGLTNAIDVLTAVREEYAARRDHLAAQYSVVINWLVLHRWGGELGAEQVRQANAWLRPPSA